MHCTSSGNYWEFVRIYFRMFFLATSTKQITAHNSMNDSGQSGPITRQYFYQALHCLRSEVRRLPPAPPGVDFDLLRNMMLAHDRAVLSRRDAQAIGSVATEVQSHAPAPGPGLPAHISQPVNIFLGAPYVVSQTNNVSTSGLFAPTGSTSPSPINTQAVRSPPLPQMAGSRPAATNEGRSYLSHTLSHDSNLSWRETTQNQLSRQSNIRPSRRTPGGACRDIRAMPTITAA